MAKKRTLATIVTEHRLAGVDDPRELKSIAESELGRAVRLKTVQDYLSNFRQCGACQNQAAKRRWHDNNREEANRKKRQKYHRGDELKRYFRDYCRRRRQDPAQRLLHALRVRLCQALNGLEKKEAATKELVGCSIEQLWSHLEAQFQPGMTRENYGDWHVDHVRPCASFDLADPAQQRECFHFSNLQPLWARDNLAKGARPRPDSNGRPRD